jgi:glutaminyl-tRNA synthetase
VKGTSHWVSAPHAVSAQIRLFEHLFQKENPEEEEDVLTCLNEASMDALEGCLLEPGLRDAEAGTVYQFLRQGYFCLDAELSTAEKPVFNRTVALRDSWAKIEKKQAVHSA